MATEIKWADGQAILAESEIRWSDGGVFCYWYEAESGTNVEVSATCQSLILTKYNATVNAEINVAATCPGLVVTQYDATVNAEVSIAAGYDELTLTQYPATVNLGYTLMTEGVYIMVDLGGGVVYLKPTSPKIKAVISTGHVTEI